MDMTSPTAEPLTREAAVSLREVAAETVREVCALAVAPDQTSYVADNALSIAQAYFAPEAWFRAVYADETPVGFVMLYQDPEKAEYHVWRFMIDQRYQGLGFGRQAVERVIDHVRSQPGGTELTLSYVPGERSPEAFYRSLGFVETGVEDDGELEMRLDLQGAG